jgi:hypothetical protein
VARGRLRPGAGLLGAHLARRSAYGMNTPWMVTGLLTV